MSGILRKNRGLILREALDLYYQTHFAEDTQNANVEAIPA
jgi:hypothetical protein